MVLPGRLFKARPKVGIFPGGSGKHEDRFRYSEMVSEYFQNIKHFGNIQSFVSAITNANQKSGLLKSDKLIRLERGP